MINQKLIEQLIKQLLDDDEFVLECRIQIEEMYKDKKIDINDIPEILSLIVILSQKYYLFTNITQQDIYEIFLTLIVELFKKFNIFEEDDPKINMMIESCLKLLVLQIKIKKSNCWCFIK